MCPPIIAMAATVASTALSAYGSIQQGQQAKAQADAQAQMYNRQASATQLQADYQAGRKQDEINQISGRQMAGVSGSGVTIDGSPSDVMASTASEGALDVGAIKWNAGVQKDDLMYQSKMSTIQGKNAMTGAYLGAAGSILGGLGKLGGQMTSFGTSFGDSPVKPSKDYHHLLPNGFA